MHKTHQRTHQLTDPLTSAITADRSEHMIIHVRTLAHSLTHSFNLAHSHVHAHRSNVRQILCAVFITLCHNFHVENIVISFCDDGSQSNVCFSFIIEHGAYRNNIRVEKERIKNTLAYPDGWEGARIIMTNDLGGWRWDDKLIVSRRLGKHTYIRVGSEHVEHIERCIH